MFIVLFRPLLLIMAPRFNRGGKRGTQDTVVDARQIIQRNKSASRIPTNQAGRYNQQLAGRLGVNRKNIQIGSKRLNPNSNLAGRIGNVRKQPQTGFRSNLSTNIVKRQIGQANTILSNKKVQFLGKKLLVTSKQEIKNQISFQDSPMLPTNRNTVNQTSIEAIEEYLRAANVSSRPSYSAPIRSNYSSASPSIRSFGLLVSNLHPSVTEDDIIELFSDVGTVSSAKLQHPGAALIIYDKREDAEKACKVYHNRLLDDLPMQCSILGCDQQNKSRIAARLGGRIDPSPSQSSFSAPMFHNRAVPASMGGAPMPSRSRPLPMDIQPAIMSLRQAFGCRKRDVTFTVKLP